MLDDKHTLSATSISLLILQELKLMRQDMKDGLSNLRQANCNKCKGNGKVGNNNDGVAFTLPVVATHEKSGEENPINHIESALDSHKPSKELEHNNCKIPPNATSSDRLELARTSINIEKLKGMSLLENSTLKIEEPSREFSDEQASLSEAQSSELSDLQITCVYGNFNPNISNSTDDINNDISTTDTDSNGMDTSIASSGTKSIPNANTSINMEQNAVVSLPVVAAKRKQNGELSVVKTVKPLKSIVATHKYQLRRSSKHCGSIRTKPHVSLDQLTVAAEEEKSNKKENIEVHGVNAVGGKKLIPEVKTTAKVKEEVESQTRPVCPKPDTHLVDKSSIFSWQYFYDHFNKTPGDFSNDNVAVKNKRKRILATACKHCGKDFGSHYKMRQHILLTHHPKPKFVCSYCKKIFVCKQHMTIHVRNNHTGEKPFACRICGKKFPCIGNCNHHIKTFHK